MPTRSLDERIYPDAIRAGVPEGHANRGTKGQAFNNLFVILHLGDASLGLGQSVVEAGVLRRQRLAASRQVCHRDKRTAHLCAFHDAVAANRGQLDHAARAFSPLNGEVFRLVEHAFLIVF